MKNIKVIINTTHGNFTPGPGLNELIKEVKVPLWSIQGRTNEIYIKYIEEHQEMGLLRGVHDWTAVRVVEVDTSKPWYIENYDNAESVRSLNYTVLDEELNYIEMN